LADGFILEKIFRESAGLAERPLNFEKKLSGAWSRVFSTPRTSKTPDTRTQETKMNFTAKMNKSPESAVLKALAAASAVLERKGEQQISIVSQTKVYMTDKYHAAITKVAEQLGSFTFSQIYYPVCIELGATPQQAAQCLAPCPKNGNLMNQGGRIRSWVEEHSPHSRQHYFRAGRLVAWKPNTRPLLFVNEVLGQKNAALEWKPYGYARGHLWSYNPEAAEEVEKPSQAILEAAAALYKKKGMRGSNHVAAPRTTQVTKVNYVAKAAGSVTVIC